MFPLFHTSYGFFIFQCWKHPWINIDFCGYMLCYYIPFWVYINNECPPLDIIKFLVTTLRNQDNKVSFVQFDEYGELSRSSEYISTCHNIIILFQTTGGDASYINGKSESYDNTLANITRYLLLKSIHKKEHWWFSYQYAIWISHRTDNRLCDDVAYFLCHRIIHWYKNIKIWGVRAYIINGCVTINNMDYISYRVYFVGYVATTVVIIYWNIDQHFVIHIYHHVWFDEYNSCIYIKVDHNSGYLLLQQDPETCVHN